MGKEDENVFLNFYLLKKNVVIPANKDRLTEQASERKEDRYKEKKKAELWRFEEREEQMFH